MYTEILTELIEKKIFRNNKPHMWSTRNLVKFPTLIAEVENVTSFLDPSMRMFARLCVIYHNIQTQPTCLTCGSKITDVFKRAKIPLGFPSFCSTKCNVTNSVTKQKRKLTCLDRYGTTNPATSLVIKQKIKNRFDELGHQMRDPIIKQQAIETRYKNNKRYKNVNDCDQERVFNLLNDKEWLANQHQVLKKSGSQIAKELNVSHSLIVHSFKYLNLPFINVFSSASENELYEYIKSIVSQNTVISKGVKRFVGRYEVDIYIPTHKLAFEFNGIYRHSDACGKLPNYHNKKSSMCHELCVDLIHIYESDWVHKNSQTKKLIKNIILSKEAPASITSISLENETIAKTFIAKNDTRNVPIFDLCVVERNSRNEIISLILLNEEEVCYTYVFSSCSLTKMLEFIRAHLKLEHCVSICVDRNHSLSSVYNFLYHEFHQLPQPLYFKSSVVLHPVPLPEWNSSYNKIYKCGVDVYKWYVI